MVHEAIGCGVALVAGAVDIELDGLQRGELDGTDPIGGQRLPPLGEELPESEGMSSPDSMCTMPEVS
ncbi:hypothetical protein FMUBM48_30500 [Nocardia cyriacigeorgica]|nr:hypothetical protein FMUBM48_30500 [Nocardia cyriacigeorgica]